MTDNGRSITRSSCFPIEVENISCVLFQWGGQSNMTILLSSILASYPQILPKLCVIVYLSYEGHEQVS